MPQGAVPAPPPTGLFMDLPVTILADQAQELLLAPAGGAAGQLGDSESRFYRSNMLPGLPAAFVLNSFSRGTGLMTSEMDAFGEVYQTTPAEGWSFMVYGVSGQGWPSGEIYGIEEAAAGGVLGDLFIHVDPGSEDVLPTDYIGFVEKIRDGVEMGIADLKGVDTYMPGYALGGELPDQIGVEGEVFFFTVTLDSVGYPGATYDDLPSGWAPPTLDDWKGPATIFSVEYENGAWKAPTVCRTPLDLGLSTYQGDDPANGLTVIDGLSVMDQPGIGAEVLLSTTDDDLDLQLWVVGSWLTVAGVQVKHTGPLRTSAGGLYVQDALKIPPQKGIRGICGDDPAAPNLVSWRHFRRVSMTAFADPRTYSSPGLDFSAHRVPWVGGRDQFRFRLQGFVGNRDRYAELVMVNPSGQPSVLGQVSRNYSQGLDPQELRVSIPSQPAGSEVRYQWLVYDSNGIVGVSYELYFYVD